MGHQTTIGRVVKIETRQKKDWGPGPVKGESIIVKARMTYSLPEEEEEESVQVQLVINRDRTHVLQDY